MRRRPAIVDEQNQRARCRRLSAARRSSVRPARRSSAPPRTGAAATATSGVRAGVSSSPQAQQQSQRRKDTRRGEGGVTRSRNQIAGSTIRPPENPRRAETECAEEAHRASRDPHLRLRAAECRRRARPARFRAACRCDARDSSSPAGARDRASVSRMRAEARAIGALHGLGAAEDFAFASGRRLQSACGP